MKALLLAVVVMFLVPVASTLLPINVTGLSVQASDKKTRKVPAIREATYKKLAEAQIMIDPESAPREEGEPPPEPNGTPRDGINMLLKLLERRGLNSYEKAQVWNTLAFGYFTIEDLPNTIRAYENVIAAGTITEALEKNSLRALFQLYYSEEQYRKALDYIARWEVLNEGTTSAVTFVKATAYYQMENYRESLKYALQLEELAVQEEREVKENWLYLQVVLYNELKDIPAQIRVLERMVVKWPKKQYWMHLAGMYSETNQDDRSLSAYYAVYKLGLLEKESEIVMLAQRMLNADIPYEAARVLEKGFKSDIIEENEKHLKLLATCYTLAQEKAKAIDAWKDATRYAEDGELFYRLAQALAQSDRHKEAAKAYQDAIDYGDLEDESDVQFWLGISLMQLENWDSAIRAFREASKGDDRMQKQARQYVRYINGEKRRQEELRKMLEGP